MSLESEVNSNDPADQLRADIESAIEAQEKGREPDVAETPDAVEGEAAEETAASLDERERDEKGRFKARADSDEEVADQAEKQAETETKVEPAPAEPVKSELRPPPGFSVLSKQAWDYANPSPDEWNSIKADIVKREQEVDSGFKSYAGLKPFAQEAERNGTTLQNAIADYDSIEKALKQNFVGGVEYICQRLGVDPRRLAGVMASRYGIAAQSNGQAAPVAAQTQPQPAFDQQALMAQLREIARAEADARVQAMKEEAERAQIDRDIAAFGADHKNKFFANVRQDMAALVQAGKANNLQEAYEAASWLNPEIRSILIKETNGGGNKEAAAAASKARNAAKAVGGAPGPGTNPDAATRRKDLTLEEEINAAIDAQMGQI